MVSVLWRFHCIYDKANLSFNIEMRCCVLRNLCTRTSRHVDPKLSTYSWQLLHCKHPYEWRDRWPSCPVLWPPLSPCPSGSHCLVHHRRRWNQSPHWRCGESDECHQCPHSTGRGPGGRGLLTTAKLKQNLVGIHIVTGRKKLGEKLRGFSV